MEAFAQRYYECNPHIYATAGKFKIEKRKKKKHSNKILVLLF